MKRVLIVSFALMVLASCGNNDSSSSGEKKDTTAAPAGDDLSANPDYQRGLAIEAANDCATCHKIDEKVQGPSFQDIAAKYSGYPDTIVTHLANKIRDGGSGVWGDILMIPHPQLSQDSAEAIVKYILLLKK